MSAYRDGIRLGVAGAAAAAAIYFPQPLAARIQTSFDVSVLWAAMPMTFAFIVLTSGPVLFGRFITVARAMRIVIVTEQCRRQPPEIKPRAPALRLLHPPQ